ncbi:MAG: hypothetical protein JNL58_12220 [Planctomyces sp.]|nr:hypothetical protein [Planctomyces sp.]
MKYYGPKAVRIFAELKRYGFAARYREWIELVRKLVKPHCVTIFAGSRGVEGSQRTAFAVWYGLNTGTLDGGCLGFFAHALVHR